MNRPKDFARAIQWDKEIRNTKQGLEMFIHREMKPLDEVDFRNLEDMGQQRLEFGEECEGMCGV